MADNNTSYIVVNKQTKEIYQRNGAIAEFASYHAARQIRITINEQSKIEHDIAGTTSTWTERPKDWQVVEFQSVKTRAENRTVDKELASGIYMKTEEVIYRAIGEIKAIKRAPNARSGRRAEVINVEQLAKDLEVKKADIKRLEERLVRMEARKEGMEPGLPMMRMMERIIKTKMQINSDRAEAKAIGMKMMKGVNQRRQANNAVANNTTTTKKSSVMLRRKSS